MTAARQPYRKSSWAAGLLVLVGLGWTIWTLLVTAQSGERARGLAAAASPTQGPAVAQEAAAPAPAPPPVRTIDGVVRFPSGTPAAGATVTVYRALTAAPELRLAQLDQAITGFGGTFRFDLPERDGLLVRFTHGSYAGDLLEVPELRDRLDLVMRPGFELGGIVYDNRGAPLGGVRVAAESAIDDTRRVEVTTSTANGGFRFEQLPAGLVRLVARHPRWQAVGQSVLVGETRESKLRFTAPAAAPLRGRVVSTVQVPIEGAVLQLMPTNGRLGLVDPIAATSDSDGEFELTGLSRGPMSLLVRHPQHGTLRRTISVGASPTETILELPPRSQVRGHVRREQGREQEGGEGASAVADLTLEVTDAGGEIYRAMTDSVGAFVFDRPLSPGRATVVVLGGDHAFARSQSFELGVQIEEQALTDWPLVVTEPTIVRGRCVDSDDEPISNVSVFGIKQLTASNLIGSNLASLIGTLGEEVALSLGSDLDSLLAISAADGTFEFRAQQPGPLLLRYDLPAHAERRVRVVVPTAGTVGELEPVVIPRGSTIAGVVRRGRGAIAGATVSIVGSESQATVITRRGGRFHADNLMPGSYRVRARLPSMPAGHAEETVEVSLDEPKLNLELELPAGRLVEGTVTGELGQPVANALISVRGAGGQPTETDAGGRFSLELPERTVELEVSLNDQSIRLTRTVDPRENNLEIRIDAPPTCTLVSRIAGLPGRKRVPAVLLRVQRVVGSAPGEDRARWVEVQNGELRWPFCPIGLCRIEIRCEGYAPLVLQHEFAANEERDLGEVLLEPGARVRGIVLDANGKPVANARVFAGDEADLDAFDPQVVSGADGTFEVRGISSRSSSLTAHAVGYAPVTRQLLLPGDVLSGQALELSLERGAVITVEVQNAPESGLVQLLRNGRLLASAVLDDVGHAEFVDRGPGRYSVRLYGGERAPASVAVEEPGQTVRVVLE